MPQFSEKKKLILTFLVVNCEMNQLTEKEARRYIKHNFGRDVSRRTYYNYRNSVNHNYEKTVIQEYNKRHPTLQIHHDLAKSNKGLISMAMMTERISIIKKGLQLDINLSKYDKPVIDYEQYIANQDAQTKALLEKSKKLIEKIQSKKKKRDK